MTKKERELLLKDLSARLPYSTLCYCKWTKDAPNGTSGCVQEVSTYLLEELMIIGDQNYECQICKIKPYLRPMSSMTKEEKEEWHATFDSVYDLVPGGDPDNEDDYDDNWHEQPGIESYDWLNEHHFDYRGLIEKGLALEATENMYQI